MQVLRVGMQPRNYNFNVQDVKNSHYINKNNGLMCDTVSFNAKKVVENLIVEDLSKFDLTDCNTTNYSEKLKKIVEDLDISTYKGKNGRKIYTVYNKTNEILKIETNNKHRNIKPGFVIGKSGMYATLEVPSSKGKYLVILPQGSRLRTEDGLSLKVTGNKKSNLSFTGSTCTVNAFYKPEKTIESINDFIKMTENSEIFDGINKSEYNYSEYFHPYLLAGGFGSRLEAISYSRNDNKPSTSTPIPNWNLVDFSLLNLYQANLLDKNTDIDFCVQKEANSAVGCFITTLGYKIGVTDEGIDLIKDGKSIVPENKHIIIMPSDNITDVNLTKVLDAYLKTNNAGMMVVGVPDYRCYGGLILHNDKNEIEKFITKPSAELLDTGLGRIKYKDADGNEKVLTDGDGLPTSLGNAFIYIINPDILDTITDIYRNKIRTSYKDLMASKTSYPTMNKEEYLKVIESFWDREIIPQLVEMSKSGQLKDKNGNELKVVTHESIDADWSDVGEYSSYYKTIKNLAKDDCFVNMPAPIKQAVKNNISGNVIFNVDVKDEFEKFIGDGFVRGNIVVVPKN